MPPADRPAARVTRPARRPGHKPRPARASRLALHAGAMDGGDTEHERPWMRWLAFAAIAAYAAAALAMIFGPHSVGDVFTETDFYGGYGPGARALMHGHLDPSRYGVVGPVYEALLALVGFVVRDLFLAAQLLSAGAMVAVLLLWRSLLVRLAGRGAPGLALATVALLAANTQFFRYGWAATSDAPALALQAATLWALLGAPAPSPRRVFAAGVLAALAFLTRYNSITLLPAGLVAILAGWTATGGDARARRADALRFVAGFLAPVVPWLAYSTTHGGSLQMKLHHNIAFEVFARPRGIVWDLYERDLESQFPTPWSVFARDPAAVLSRIAFNVFDHLRLDAKILLTWPLAAAAAIGTVLAWRDGTLARLRAVWLAAVLAFLALVPAFHSERWSLAVLPAWATLAAAAFASPRLALVMEVGGRRVWGKALLFVALVGLTAAGAWTHAQRQVSQLPVEARKAADLVRPLVRPGDRVMARKPHFGWYAGMETAAFPLEDSLATIAAAARRQGARWLYFSWPEAQLRPRYEWLLDTSAVVPGLTPRAVIAKNPAVVYEIGPEFGRDPGWLASDTLLAVHRARARRMMFTREVDARFFLADWERAHGRYEAAQPILEELLAIRPEDPDALLMAAENLLKLERADEADRLLERVERLHPGSAEVALGRGWAALGAGRVADAARFWAPLVPSTNDPATLQRMLVVFESAGDGASAAAVRARLRAAGQRP